MSNKMRGNVDFKIGDRQYTLCYDHGALIELEDQLDRGIVAISNELQKWQQEPERVRLKWVRALLYAGLKKNHPKIVLDDVNDLLTAAGQGPQVMEAIGEAMNAAFGSSAMQQTGGDARPTNGATPSSETGVTSSPNTSPSATN